MHWLSITNEFPHQISSTFFEYDTTLIRDFIKDRNLMLWIPRSAQNLTCIELNSIGITSVVTKKSFHNDGLASYSNIFPCRPWANAVHHLQQHWPCRDAHWLSKSYQDNHISNWFLETNIASRSVDSIIYNIASHVICVKFSGVTNYS